MRKEKFEVDGGKCMSDLYVSDLDGTLLTGEKKITEENRKAHPVCRQSFL